MPSPQIYFHTIRHLKPTQIFWQLRYRLFPPSGHSIEVKNAKPRADIAVWANYLNKPQTFFAPYQFKFLNQQFTIRTKADWNLDSAPMLWRYNLHYFDDLVSSNASQRLHEQAELIDRWIAENPVGAKPGWDAYPTSLRIVNWIKWSLAGNGLDANAIESLAQQGGWLFLHLEYHLLANHLFANAKALIFAGCFFEGALARRWLDKGLKILSEQLPEQILRDGGHFERSPMYHATILEDCLDLLQLANLYSTQIPALQDKLVSPLKKVLPNMLAYLNAMTHPDGEIAFFNDAAMKIAAPVSTLNAYADALSIERVNALLPLVYLNDSGYARTRAGAFTLFFDMAAVGPDYQPGHAHADTLSFELSCHQQRVICNSGVSTYAEGATRTWERSTAAHSTIEIDGQNSSETWGAFRVARRAYPIDAKVERRGEVAWMQCRHDGYQRLPGKPIHTRTLAVSPNEVDIVDEITGGGLHDVVCRFPLHPDANVIQLDAGCWQITLPDNQVLVMQSHDGITLQKEDGFFAPEFGIRLRRDVIFWIIRAALPVKVHVSIQMS